MNKLKELRMERGVQRTWLERKLGMGYRSLESVETGKTSITGMAAGTLYRLARFYGVTMESILADLVDAEDKENPNLDPDKQVLLKR